MSKTVILFQPSHGMWDGLFIRIPASVLSVASMPYQAGYDVKIIDQRVMPDWKVQLVKYAKLNPICLGVTSLTGPSLQWATEAIEIVKQVDHSIPVVFGGVHATVLPQQTLNYGVDIVLVDEGDYRFLEVIQALEQNKPLNDIKGLHFRQDFQKDGEVIYTGPAPMIMDMDALPEYPYDLIDMEKYVAVEIEGGKSISLQTSRGCSYVCTFCGNKFLQKAKMRTLSPSELTRRITKLQDTYGYDTFVFVDDLTFGKIDHFREFTTALANLEKKISWSTTGIRADLVSKFTDEDLDLLVRSGCKTVDIGIESGSPRILRFIKKGKTIEMMRTANMKLAKTNIIVKYTFIVGYPVETDEERNQTVNFYKELADTNHNVFPMLFVYVPIVGTELYNFIIREGYLKEPQTAEEWIMMDSYHWYGKFDNWVPMKKRASFETMMISSVFCSRNGKFKYTRPLSRLGFELYHPIAYLRYKYKFFGIPFEVVLIDLFANIKKILGQTTSKLSILWNRFSKGQKLQEENLYFRNL